MLTSFKAIRRFSRLREEQRTFVFFAEDRTYFPYFRELINELVDNRRVPICYLTCDASDPILYLNHPRILTFNIGSKLALTALFLHLRCKFLISTTPDLQTYHLRRSLVDQVHYVYIFHAMTSTHMVYREGAFDNFDSVFCVGKHQVEEIRQWEKLRNLPPKQLYPVGYSPLDCLQIHRMSHETIEKPSKGSLTIVLAPTWSEFDFLKHNGTAICHTLLEAGHTLIVRPHPRTIILNKELPELLIGEFGHHPKFQLQTDITQIETLWNSDILISDWSGIALEYAFGFERPVLFIDATPKVNNPNFRQISSIPIEVQAREKIGKVVSLSDLGDIDSHIQDLWSRREELKENIRRWREEIVFNPMQSAKIAADLLLKMNTAKDSGLEHAM